MSATARLHPDNVVVLTPPETSRAYRGGGKETHYTFTKAFGEHSEQKELFEHVGRPLVKDLVTGWNSLLFMYGVTGLKMEVSWLVPWTLYLTVLVTMWSE